MNRRNALNTIGALSAVGLSGCTSQSLLGSGDNGKYTAEPITDAGYSEEDLFADGTLRHIGISWYYDGTYYGIVGKVKNTTDLIVQPTAQYEFFHDSISIGTGSVYNDNLVPHGTWEYRIPNEYSEKEPDEVEYGYVSQFRYG